MLKQQLILCLGLLLPLLISAQTTCGRIRSCEGEDLRCCGTFIPHPNPLFRNNLLTQPTFCINENDFVCCESGQPCRRSQTGQEVGVSSQDCCERCRRNDFAAAGVLSPVFVINPNQAATTNDTSVPNAFGFIQLHLYPSNSEPNVHISQDDAFRYDDWNLRVNMWLMNVNNIQSAHIHTGFPCENGPILFDLLAGTDAAAGSETLVGSSVGPEGRFFSRVFTSADISPEFQTQENLRDLWYRISSGMWYADVKTTEAPNGLIRGPIVRTWN